MMPKIKNTLWISWIVLIVAMWAGIGYGAIQRRHYSKLPPHKCVQGQTLHPGEKCYFTLTEQP